MRPSFPQKRPTLWRAALPIIVAMSLSACSQMTVEADYPENTSGATEESGSVFELFGVGNSATAEQTVNADAPDTSAAPAPRRGLAVNADLWRAALETISFMPLASSDPVGGIIITDWYNDPGTVNERFKINVVISGRELRADALRVSVFRETEQRGRWVSVAASPLTARKLENIMLSRARTLVQKRGGR